MQRILELIGVDEALGCTVRDVPEQAAAGKVTICHATGSASNPLVEITISENGLNGHGDHEGDIIPAPAGGCPALTVPDDAEGGGVGGGGVGDGAETPAVGKVEICHATGSATNPFVVIEISVNGLNGHGDHEGDIVPAPAGGCPIPAEGDGTAPDAGGDDTTGGDGVGGDGAGGDGETATGGGDQTTAGGDATTGGDATAGGDEAGSGDGTATAGAAEGPAEAAAAGGDTAQAGADAAGGGQTATAGAADEPGFAAEGPASDDGQLPFTGLALGVLALLAAAALATGVASHRHGGRRGKRTGAR